MSKREPDIQVHLTGEAAQVERAREVIHEALTAAGYTPPIQPVRHLRVVRADDRKAS